MPNRRAWHTPNAGNEGVTIVRPLFIPLPYLPMVAGALVALTEPQNWEQVGTATPQHAAEHMAEMLFQWVNAGVGAVSQFRLTEDCEFEYSNDNGETWEPVPGWSEYAASCFVQEQEPAITSTVLTPVDYDDPASLNFNPATKTLTLELPTGFPPETTAIQTVATNAVNGDTPPALAWNPATKTLTMTSQEQWLRGLHFDADLEWEPVDFIPAHRLTVSTYDEPEARIPIAFIPPYVRSGFLTAGITDIVNLPATDEAIACGMATMLIDAMIDQWNTLLSKLGIAADISETISEMAEYFYALGIPIAFQVLSDAVTTAFNLGQEALEGAITPEREDIFLCKLYCLLLEYGSFDGAVLILWREWVNEQYPVVVFPDVWLFANQITYIDMQFWKRRALIGSLDPLETCALCDCDPDDGWCQLFDFTESNHGFTILNAGTYVEGEGWRTTLATFGNLWVTSVTARKAANQSGVLTKATLTYTATPGYSGTNGQQTIVIAGNANYGNSLYIVATQVNSAGWVPASPQIWEDEATIGGIALQLTVAHTVEAFNPGGVGTITSLKLEGTGENPFGESNC